MVTRRVRRHKSCERKAQRYMVPRHHRLRVVSARNDERRTTFCSIDVERSIDEDKSRVWVYANGTVLSGWQETVLMHDTGALCILNNAFVLLSLHDSTETFNCNNIRIGLLRKHYRNSV